MKTMKLWKNILVMTAAMFFLASCSSDDNGCRTRKRKPTGRTFPAHIRDNMSLPIRTRIARNGRTRRDGIITKPIKKRSAVCNSMCPTTRCSMYSFKTSPCR